MKKLILLFFAFLFFVLPLSAQSPYELKPGRELALFGTGAGLMGASYYFHKNMDPLTELQIAEYKAEGLSNFERWVTTQRSIRSHKASDIVLYSSTLYPVALTLVDKSMRKDAFKISNMYGQVFLINAGLTALIKNTVRRGRPYVYGTYLSTAEKMTKSARNSFPSGHTSQTASMSFLAARLYADYHPDSKWKPVVWTVAAAMPLTTGILRMTAGKHFPTDVIVGYAIGAAVGYFVPVIHRRTAN